MEGLTQAAPGEHPTVNVRFDFDVNGILHISATDRTSGQQGEIRVQIVSPQGNLGAQHVIAAPEVTRPAGFPQMAVAGDELILAWTDASGDPTRVQTARIAP